MIVPDPVIKLDPNGKAPILSYNVPEPTSYSGRNGIVLDFGNKEPLEAIFTDLAFQTPGDLKRKPISDLPNITVDQVTKAIRLGDRKIFPNIVNPAATSASLFSGQLAVRQSKDGELDVATTSVLARGLR